jgi:hypothetical protein
MVASSRRRPIQTLPALSAQRAWNSATSGWIARATISASFCSKGLASVFQSSRRRVRSEPITPRSGMNGTPFSAACRPECTIGQVASTTRSRPCSTAAEKRGASPASPSETALVSTSRTQPAPISRSAQKPSTGTPSRRRSFASRRISARTTSIATSE